MPVYVSDLLAITPAPVNAVPTATRAWQWLRGSTAISGATSSTYTAVTADIGSPIAASQLETNFLGTATATSAPTEVIQAFDPIRLFSASEPGVWYDPNDISTLYKEPAGINPVTAPGDNVGLMLDKSRGLALGLELVSNPGPFANTTGWLTTSATPLAVSGGILTGTTAVATDGVIYGSWLGTLGPSAQNKYFQITTTITALTGRVRLQVYGSNVVGPWITSPGTYTVRLYQTVANGSVGLNTDQATTVSISAFGAKEVLGNHATQPTTASQPIYGIVPAGGRRNQVLWSEDFSNAVWAKDSCTVVANTTLAPDGTTTADRIVSAAATTQIGVGQGFPTTPTATAHTASYYVQANGARYVQLLWSTSLSTNHANFDLQAGTVTGGTYTAATITAAANGFYRITITSTLAVAAGGSFLWFVDSGTAARAAAYTGNGTSGIYVWGAQLEQSTTATPYQRVTTQYDVTEAGVASLGYLFFDGSGDFMSTGTITPGTDKAQVFTGVRKLNDTIAVVAEFSPDLNTSNGGFLFLSGTNNVTGFELTSRGTTSGLGTTGRYAIAAPVTVVFTGIADISAPLSRVRVNGVVGIDGTSTQGTGNFLAYPLYIGRRGGTSLPFNGHIHSLIVRFGPNLTTARISATESWVASKTAGVPAL